MSGDDEPEMLFVDGSSEWLEWFRDGDMSTIVDEHGTQTWYKDGKLHRDGDMPAIETFYYLSRMVHKWFAPS